MQLYSFRIITFHAYLIIEEKYKIKKPVIIILLVHVSLCEVAETLFHPRRDDIFTCQSEKSADDP